SLGRHTPPRPFFARIKSTRQVQYGELAQLGERLVCNQEVTGSSPVFSTVSSRAGTIDARLTRRPRVEATRVLFQLNTLQTVVLPTTHTQCAWTHAGFWVPGSWFRAPGVSPSFLWSSY